MQSMTAVEAGSMPSMIRRTMAIAPSDRPAIAPTQTYKVGVGDVLFIDLKNAAHGSGYHTVRFDGTIDFALASEDIVVVDRTVDEIERMLASRITLYPDPQLEIKVREFCSHKITVSGLVANPGEKHLQREAIPLYVVQAEAMANSSATRVLITRAPLLRPESYDLSDPSTDNVLIFPGNSVDFGQAATSRTGVYFISGDVLSPGQKDLISGLTLYQAIASSGGAKGSPKKAVLRRKSDKGVFATSSYDLRSIRDGKLSDPILFSGDVIEIKN